MQLEIFSKLIFTVVKICAGENVINRGIINREINE